MFTEHLINTFLLGSPYTDVNESDMVPELTELTAREYTDLNPVLAEDAEGALRMAGSSARITQSPASHRGSVSVGMIIFILQGLFVFLEALVNVNI